MVIGRDNGSRTARRPHAYGRRTMSAPAPRTGRVRLLAGPGRVRALNALALDEGLPRPMAEAALSGSARVREHAHGAWRYLAVPAFASLARGRSSRRDGEVLSVLVAPGWLVMVAPTSDGPAARLGMAMARHLGREVLVGRDGLSLDEVRIGPALCTLLGLAVEAAFGALDRLSASAQRIESQAVVYGGGKAGAGALLGQRRRAEAIRASLAAMRDGVGILLREPPRGVGGRFPRRMRDIEEHLFQAFEAVDAARDELTSALGYHLAASQNRVNEVIKTLTVLATVLTPITVISSIYGMNFAIPETQWRYGYLFALGLMAACAGALVLYFRRRGWI